MQKLNWQHTFFDSPEHFTGPKASLHLPFMACWWCAKRMAEKGDYWVSSGCLCMQKMTKEKFAKFDNQLTFEPWKVPTTSQQSTINLALCVVSMVWEKEIEEHFYCFQPLWQVLTHVYHSGFFVDCCRLHLWHWMEWSISCSYQVLYLVPSCLTLLPGMIPMFGTRYQEYHQIVGPRSSILYLTTPLLWVPGTVSWYTQSRNTIFWI